MINWMYHWLTPIPAINAAKDAEVSLIHHLLRDKNRNNSNEKE